MLHIDLVECYLLYEYEWMITMNFQIIFLLVVLIAVEIKQKHILMKTEAKHTCIKHYLGALMTVNF